MEGKRSGEKRRRGCFVKLVHTVERGLPQWEFVLLLVYLSLRLPGGFPLAFTLPLSGNEEWKR